MTLRISTLDPRLPDDPLFIAFSAKDGVSLLGARLAACKMVKAVILNRKFLIVEQRDIPLRKSVSDIFEPERTPTHFFARVILLYSGNDIGFIICIGENGEVSIFDIGDDVSAGVECRHDTRVRI